jgi:uncharacterized membrane protein
MKKRVPPLITILIGLVFYILGFTIFKDSLIGTIFNLASLIFFLLAIAGMISGHSKRKIDLKDEEHKDNKLNQNTKILIIVILSIFILGLIYYAQKISRENNSDVQIDKVDEIESVTNNFIGSGTEKAGKNEENSNPTININENSSVNETSIPVGTFYDGQEGFSLSIPSGNKSTCIWTYSAGSSRIPNSITTDATTATEKHTISVYGDEEDLKVTCVDDFGNNYTGIFPNK